MSHFHSYPIYFFSISVQELYFHLHIRYQVVSSPVISQLKFLLKFEMLTAVNMQIVIL